MTDEVIDEISDIRVRNNRLWMTLLRLAIKHAPKDAKAVIRLINENDQRISKLLAKLADTP